LLWEATDSGDLYREQTPSTLNYKDGVFRSIGNLIMTFERHATVAARVGITGCLLCLSVAFTSVSGLAADIPEAIRRIEAEAASCQSAAAAARVYAVALTSSSLSDNDRAVA